MILKNGSIELIGPRNEVFAQIKASLQGEKITPDNVAAKKVSPKQRAAPKKKPPAKKSVVKNPAPKKKGA